ncbi:MAG: pyruvate carboxylase subunit B, partial [Kiritimatiellae bacterium]|nr:pyruvate carboxylase subunit B [Kiritimatiellia bacterium]
MKKTKKISAPGPERIAPIDDSILLGNRVPLRITDTTLRDAPQSLWATRIRTKDILEIIDTIDSAGYYSLECWGGATFDVCLRFLRENPWERLREIKAHAKNTPLQMLIRGQNVLGYHNYPDDLLERFVALAAGNGIDIFRTFDALNDNRNIEKSVAFIKKYGAHAQGTICYTVSPVHTIEEFVRIAKEQEQMGVDSICIKDMAGILAPLDARRLVSALCKEISIPIQIHSHATSGMATATYLAAALAGAGAVDCAVSAMAGFSSQPPVETVAAIFADSAVAPSLDMEKVSEINRFFKGLRPLREPAHRMHDIIDPGILEHKIPGGMISNLRSQLSQQGALDRIGEVMAEVPRVRADLGYPPLVTPTSQIVGVQAVLNVLAGKRYGMVAEETKNYVRGLYGRPPAPIDSALSKKILGREKPLSGRPADALPPMLPHAVDAVEPSLIKSEEDILSYCLFPEPALSYFQWRAMPPAARPPIPADEEEKKRKADAAPVALPAKPLMAPQDYPALEGLLATVKNLGIEELVIRRGDTCVSLRESAGAPAAAQVPAAPQAPAP